MSKRCCGARGLSSHITEAGPPDRMMPLGLQPLEGLGGGVERGDLAIDPGLAHPARDQLGHLAAEIDDEDGARAG